MLRETLFSHILFKKKPLLPIVGDISMMPVKNIVLVILNPVTSAKEKYLSSQWGSAELIWNVTGGGACYNSDHLLVLGEERRDRQKNRYDANESTLKGLV